MCKARVIDAIVTDIITGVNGIEGEIYGNNLIIFVSVMRFIFILK